MEEMEDSKPDIEIVRRAVDRILKRRRWEREMLVEAVGLFRRAVLN